ncbi:MAG: Toxin YoeB [Candidatus Scalindua brodae]|uniref:Toxin YoeB n=1 Tax=Candidatus Scalindua brodae TaxID=237368 RepID=A0A0B0ETE4_9BACT|nr:MAG: Toxin YoeB [Candidatus Scalindua brodae]
MIQFTKEAWEHYLYWQKSNKNIFKRINQLIKECLRDPFVGLGNRNH